MLIGVFTHGIVSVYAFMAGGLFCAVMWPCIFALGVGGLGKFTSQGSAFLIMMILGGAVIPPFQGSIGDLTKALRFYLVAAVCFACLALIAKIKKRFKSARARLRLPNQRRTLIAYSAGTPPPFLIFNLWLHQHRPAEPRYRYRHRRHGYKIWNHRETETYYSAKSPKKHAKVETFINELISLSPLIIKSGGIGRMKGIGVGAPMAIIIPAPLNMRRTFLEGVIPGKTD